jgi:hypothetical protein
MGILNWFKNKKKEELLDLQIKKEKMMTDHLEATLQKQTLQDALKSVIGGQLHNQPQPQPQFSTGKPYKRLKFVNNVLTVVFNDGSVLNKTQATIEDFLDVKQSSTEDEIIDIMRGEEQKKDVLDEIESPPTYDAIQTVCQFPDFEISEECVYMNGINRSLPPLLIKRFAEILSKYDKNDPAWESKALDDVEYSSLKKFWLKCCLNSNAQSAEDLYTFLSHHNMKIDRHGNFFAYRRVCKVNDYMDREYGVDDGDKLVSLISGVYNNVKAIWKKKPSDFRIEKIGEEYSMHKVTSDPKGTIIGNLDTLYKELPNMQGNRYTDAHTHRMDYRIGEIASIPRHQCDDDNSVNCSQGLHASSKAYDYTGFGDTPILMIINPMDAVAVPLNEIGKLRVSRFFFAMTLDEEDKYILDDSDFDVTNLGDIFEEKCLANIEEHVHTSFTEEVVRHTFTIPQMSNVDIKNISDMLKDMNDVIKNRIIVQ